MFMSGKYYVFFVPPGWLLCGKVDRVEGDRLVLSEAAHLELTAEGSAPLSDLPRAKSESAMKKICTKSWPLAAGTELHVNGILISSPCEGDLSPLTLSHVADTIRGAK